MYSDSSLSLCLDNYWLLYEGILPGSAGRSNLNGSPIESAAILKSDIDSAMCSLGEQWRETLKAMDAYFSDGMNPRDVFYDNKKYFYRLNRLQKSIVKYHFEVEIKGKVYLEDEFEYSMTARKLMLKYLNTKYGRELDLVTNLINSMEF